MLLLRKISAHSTDQADKQKDGTVSGVPVASGQKATLRIHTLDVAGIINEQCIRTSCGFKQRMWPAVVQRSPETQEQASGRSGENVQHVRDQIVLRTLVL